MKSTIIKKYIRQVKRLYKGKRKYKKQFIQELEDALLCFMQEHPQATYSDLTDEFGKPSEIKSFLSFHTAHELRKRKLYLYWAINILCVLVIAVILFFTIRHLIGRYEYANGYYIEFYDDEVENPHMNPFTKETDPPILYHDTFD